MPIVYFFLLVCFVIAWPISLCLDWILGVEVSGTYSRSELMEIVEINKDREAKFEAEELGIVRGALKFSETRASSCMTPLDAAYHIDSRSVLDKVRKQAPCRLPHRPPKRVPRCLIIDTQALIMELLSKGHSRIPVHRPGDKADVFAVLFSDDLIGIGYDKRLPVMKVIDTCNGRARLHKVKETTSIINCFKYCQKQRVHLLVVTDDAGTTVGLLSMEDILEEIVQEEIVDESDPVINQAAISDRNSLVTRANSMLEGM